MPNDFLEPRFRALRRYCDSVARTAVAIGLPTIDEAPACAFTPTGDPLVWTMPFAYVQSSIDCDITGYGRLMPGEDFTTSGITFTLRPALGDNLAAGDALRVFRGRRS